MEKNDSPIALLLLGPTASGKSAMSLEIAKRIPTEIISIDSALVYRGMDIGSAKPNAEELSVCPHHLIDVREIGEPYSAADFVEDATRLVPEIRARGRLPLIVGGTMLYAKALREGLNDMPTTTPQVREAVALEAQKHGWPAMHAKLAEVDASTAARLSPNDSQRIGRALEVYRMTGRPISSYHTTPKEPPFSFLTVALAPADRAMLHERIAQRFDAMLAQGFLDEVRVLMKRPDFDPDSPAMRAVGYRQAVTYLLGGTDLRTFREAGIAATRQLAKRQLTWIRGMSEDVLRVDPFAEGAFEQVLAAAERCRPA